jgi:hypothetical protein
MVKSTEQKLDELLEITEKVPVKKETKVIVPRPKDDEDVSADYKYSRENFYNLVERGQDAIDGILELAKESEHPRTYEVAGQLIKNVGEVTEKLLDLQRKLKDLKEVHLLNLLQKISKSSKSVLRILYILLQNILR